MGNTEIIWGNIGYRIMKKHGSYYTGLYRGYLGFLGPKVQDCKHKRPGLKTAVTSFASGPVTERISFQLCPNVECFLVVKPSI